MVKIRTHFPLFSTENTKNTILILNIKINSKSISEMVPDDMRSIKLDITATRRKES